MNKKYFWFGFFTVAEALAFALLILMIVWSNDGTLLHSKMWYITDAIVLNLFCFYKFMKHKNICFPPSAKPYNNNRIR